MATSPGGPDPAPMILVADVGGSQAATVAAATAVRSGRASHRTLLTALGAGSSMMAVIDARETIMPGDGNRADAEPGPVGRGGGGADRGRGRITEVGEGLWFQSAPGPHRRMTPGWEHEAPSGDAGSDPWPSELAVLDEMVRQATSGRWDAVVVDMGADLDALAVLRRPEQMGQALDRHAPGRGLLTRLLGSPPPGAVSRPDAGRDRVRLLELQRHLGDARRTRLRLVVPPDADRSTALRQMVCRFTFVGVPVDAAIAHGPPGDGRPVVELTQQVAPLPVLRGPEPWAPALGGADLVALGEHLYPHDPLSPSVPAHWEGADWDPGAEWPVRVRRADRDHEVVVPLPYAHRSGVALARRGGELLVTVHGTERALRLPDSVARRQVTAARWRDDQLIVRFGRREP